jgi:hypothetical protein
MICFAQKPRRPCNELYFSHLVPVPIDMDKEPRVAPQAWAPKINGGQPFGPLMQEQSPSSAEPVRALPHLPPPPLPPVASISLEASASPVRNHTAMESSPLISRLCRRFGFDKHVETTLLSDLSLRSLFQYRCQNIHMGPLTK